MWINNGWIQRCTIHETSASMMILDGPHWLLSTMTQYQFTERRLRPKEHCEVWVLHTWDPRDPWTGVQSNLQNHIESSNDPSCVAPSQSVRSQALTKVMYRNISAIETTTRISIDTSVLMCNVIHWKRLDTWPFTTGGTRNPTIDMISQFKTFVSLMGNYMVWYLN